MKKYLLLLLLAAVLLTAAGCGEKSCALVATTAPVQQLAEAVCEGTGLEVGLVISDSVSCLHDYSLSTRQMRTIERAELVILSGADLEDFLGDALDGKETVTCSEGISLLEEEDEADPHIWLSPANMEQMARNIAAGLSERWPEYAELFSANAEKLCAELEALRLECLRELSGLSSRRLITFHDGFAYFAQCFDLEIAASIEEEEGSEASARELVEMITLVRESDIPAVFVEKDGSRSAASVISAETGCAVGILDTGLSGSDYFEVIRANIAAIKEALQ